MNNTVKETTTFNKVIVTNDLPKSIEVTQPITEVVEIVGLGPRGLKGDKGDKGDSGDSLFSQIGTGIYAATSSIQITGSFSVLGPVNFDIFKIITGSVIAQVNVSNDIFSLQSGSEEFININQNTTTVTNDFFLVKNRNNETMFNVSGGVFYFQTQSQELANNYQAGALYFTSSSLFISLEN